MNWEAEMDKPLFVKKGGGFVTMRQALELRRNEAKGVVEALLDESVAVDLDGTLARDSGWRGPEHIGEPVKPMLDLVKKLLDDGEDVVIFTARVHDGEKSTKEHIKQWLKDNDLPDLEITNEKRPDMEKFYDDKAVAVEKNKGVSESKRDLISTMKQIVDVWSQEDWDWVSDGCADVTFALWSIGRKLGWPVKPVTGTAETNNENTFPHAWLDVGGSIFDPVAYANGYKVKRYHPSAGDHVQHLRDIFGVEADENYGYTPEADIERFKLLADASGVNEALLLESPTLKTLQKNKVDLEPDERKQIMKAKAVWPFGKKGADSPAVHKAVVKGKPWYWSNTHRLYHVDSTVAAAIKNFFKIVEPSG